MIKKLAARVRQYKRQTIATPLFMVGEVAMEALIPLIMSWLIDRGIQGNVLVGFVIDEKGKITDVHVIRGVDELLDDEAVRVISASPSWKPGTLNGKKVKASMSLYVEFRLEKR